MQVAGRLKDWETKATEQNYGETVALADVMKFLLGIFRFPPLHEYANIQHSVTRLEVLNKNRINVISDTVLGSALLLRAAVKFADTG